LVLPKFTIVPCSYFNSLHIQHQQSSLNPFEEVEASAIHHTEELAAGGRDGDEGPTLDPPLDSRQESSDDGREQKHPVGLVQSCAEAEQKHSSPPLQTLIRSFRTSRMAYYQQRIILVRLVAHCMAVTAPGPEFEGVARGAGADDYGVVDGCRRRPMREDHLI